ncbi:CPBP family intramembrane glutamic endopeptidase [uncultured Winogradskyella sp.]|uniref:CPBP family intramembrane glutamic endopeptidase n=1 Tax=uncultured Winogradskyella sp. TaxID=395353 RepID=UPI002607A26C|nr:CPBP family intramembrane glutamic endopeptidase [uncultured Winogradskyella sp.]
MNYIQQAYKGLYDGWRYIVGTVIVIAFVILGQLPFTAAVFVEAQNQGLNLFELNENNMMTLLESNLNLFLMLLSFAVGLVGILIVNKWLHKMTLTQLTTARKKIDWKRFWIIFFAWGILSSGLVLLDYFMSPEHYEWNFDFNKFIILAVIAILMVPLQTSCEEYLFRGYLMQGIGLAAKNKWVPLIITSVVFGMLHIANPEVEKLGYVIMVYYIGTGLFLGIMTLMDDGLELALGFHAANNLFTALLVTADWTAFQTYSIFKDTSDPSNAALVDIAIPVFVMFPIILFILSKVYGWNNWKERLFGRVTEPPKEDYKILD